MVEELQDASDVLMTAVVDLYISRDIRCSNGKDIDFRNGKLAARKSSPSFESLDWSATQRWY